MSYKVRITKFSDGRKIIELPKTIRDNYRIGEHVYITIKKINGAKEPEDGKATSQRNISANRKPA